MHSEELRNLSGDDWIFLLFDTSADVFVARVAQFFTLRERCHGHKNLWLTTSHVMDAHRIPTFFSLHSLYRTQDFKGSPPHPGFGHSEVSLVSFSTFYIKNTLLVVVFLLISCAFTVVNLWVHFYHFVICSPPPPHPPTTPSTLNVVQK